MLSACAPSGGVDPADVDGVPESWLTATAEGWPDAPAHGGGVPVLSRGECLLTSEPPAFLGGGARLTDTGWGPFGDSADGYRYLCGFWKSGSYSGELQLIQASSADETALAVDEFRSQKSSDVQDNTVEEVTSGALDMLVLTRWYPTNPKGMYQALYLDEAANAIVTLEINSLDEADFAALTPQDVADALVEVMAKRS